jgi:hypothetical protein
MSCISPPLNGWVKGERGVVLGLHLAGRVLYTVLFPRRVFSPIRVDMEIYQDSEIVCVCLQGRDRPPVTNPLDPRSQPTLQQVNV